MMEWKPFKGSLKSLKYYLEIMGESHKKIIVSHLRTIFGDLHAQMPDFDSITNPTVTDLDKIFTSLGRAVYRENLIKQVNEIISRDYGRYSALSDPVLELVELRELCLNQIDLLNKMVSAILQQHHKKESKDAQCTVAKESPVVDK
jgi:hypothetical protein